MNMRDIQGERSVTNIKGGKPLTTTGFWEAIPRANDGFQVQQVVYLKHREEKRPGLVTAVMKQSTGVRYKVAWPHLDGNAKWYFPFELCSEYEPDFP